MRKLHSSENEVRRVEYFILSISLYEIQYFASASADSILIDPLLDKLESLSHKHPRLPPTFNCERNHNSLSRLTNIAGLSGVRVRHKLLAGAFEPHLPKTVGCEKISKVQLTLTEASPGL